MASARKAPAKRAPSKKSKDAPVPRPGGQKPFDRTVVEAMAGVGATNVEIAEFLGVSEALIRKRCQPILTTARGDLRTRLRRAQLTAAFSGNPAMLIWLGKQMLEQRDKQDVTHAGDPNAPLSVTVTHRIVDT